MENWNRSIPVHPLSSLRSLLFLHPVWLSALCFLLPIPFAYDYPLTCSVHFFILKATIYLFFFKKSAIKMPVPPWLFYFHQFSQFPESYWNLNNQIRKAYNSNFRTCKHTLRMIVIYTQEVSHIQWRKLLLFYITFLSLSDHLIFLKDTWPRLTVMIS